jgi:hypothetical protein
MHYILAYIVIGVSLVTHKINVFATQRSERVRHLNITIKFALIIISVFRILQAFYNEKMDKRRETNAKEKKERNIVK